MKRAAWPLLALLLAVIGIFVWVRRDENLKEDEPWWV